MEENSLTTSEFKNTKIVIGTPISTGMAEGQVFVRSFLYDPEASPESIDNNTISVEIDKLNVALQTVSNNLFELAMRIGTEIDKELARVFEAHRAILNDTILQDEFKKEIQENLVCASSAVKIVFERWEQRFQIMESQFAQDKCDDFQDLSIRLCNALQNNSNHPLADIPNNCVLVMTRLLPSDTIFLADKSISAVLLEYGSIGSHAALFLREMGVPCVSNMKNLVSIAPNNVFGLVDAITGTIIFDPSESQKELFANKVAYQKDTFRVAHERTFSDAVSLDGIPIQVLANVGSQTDTIEARNNGADGVGLYRMENAYLGCTIPPNVMELLTEMRKTLAPAKDTPVCVRLLDVGADKPLPFMNFLSESNPALGRRGIRFLIEYPELLTTHLHALLELSREFNVSILIPMVSLPEEIIVVQDMLHEISRKNGITKIPKLGAMIETPAAALSAALLAPYVDFFSFGTNDLTQYSFAADRENASVVKYFNDESDVIFKLMKMVHEDAPDIPLSICGELGGRVKYVEKLLQCGIRTLSVAPSLIPLVKESVRNAVCIKK